MKPLIVGNWKMNVNYSESQSLARTIKHGLTLHRLGQQADLALCPSFESIAAVKKTLGRSKVAVGAQDVFWQSYGPFTGEVAAPTLQELGCKYVIVGHSERRKYLGETNEMVNHKIKSVLEADMTPILCIGETIEERREHRQDLAIMTQMIEGLAGIHLTSDQMIVVAYEPVWVIGTGQAIDPQEADRMSRVIRQALIDLFPLDIVQHQTRLLYGGSVDADNIRSFHDLELISGFLVGGASLESGKFISLIKALS